MSNGYLLFSTDDLDFLTKLRGINFTKIETQTNYNFYIRYLLSSKNQILQVIEKIKSNNYQNDIYLLPFTLKNHEGDNYIVNQAIHLLNCNSPMQKFTHDFELDVLYKI